MALISDILLRFRADTKQAKKQIKDLQGDQKKLAQAALKNAEKQNEAMDKSIAKWGKIALGVGAAVGAYKVLTGAVDAYAKRSRLQAATVGADVKGIQEAFSGLVTENEALTFAAKSMSSAFGTSQREMEEAAKFAKILADRTGIDLKIAIEEVGKAIIEGEVEPLKKFGVIVRDVQPGLEAHEALLAEITRQNQLAGEQVQTAGDRAQAAGVQWKDAIDRLVVALGSVATALTPIVEAIAAIVEGILRLPDLAVSGGGGTAGDLTGLRALARLTGGAKPGSPLAQAIAEQEALLKQSRSGRAFLAGGDKDAPLGLGFGAISGRRGAGGGFSVPDFVEGAIAPQFSLTGGRLGGFGGAGVPGGGLSEQLRLGRGFGEFDLEKFAAGIGGEKGGVPKQFSSIVEGSKLATQAMQTFQQTGQAAFEALITGSESFSSALKKAFVGGIIGMATDAAGRALWHGLLALGDLATGNLAGASANAGVAAKAAATAAALGVLARTLGAGASPSGGALPAAAAGAVGGGAAGGGGSNVTIFVGSDFEENPRGRAQRLKRAFDRAQTLEGDDTIVLPE